MNKIFVLVVLTAASMILGGANPHTQGADKSHIDGSIIVDGINRTYHLYLPSLYNGKDTVPLLIALHGGGGRGRRFEKSTTLEGFDKLAKKDGFIVVYPDGLKRHWNDGRGDPYSYSARNNINDVKFISELIDSLENKYNINKSRVYVTGISNGGMMSFRLGCALSDKISAIATVAASMPENLYRNCSPKNRISVLMIHGTNDPLVPWNGGDVVLFRKHHGKVVSIPKSVEFWTSYNKCTLQEKKQYLPDSDPNDGTRVWTEKYANTKNNTEVVLYAVEGGGHTWPDGFGRFRWITGKMTHDINACDVIWNFFKKIK